MKIINVTKMKRTMMSKTTTGENLVENEIEILKKLQSPYIVKLEEVIGDEEDGQVYLALEYVKKGSIEGYRKHMKISEDQIRKYFRHLILAIEYCHKNDIVHRDIKPDNMLITEEDDMKMTDFGISEFAKNGNDIFTNTAGTNYFFCPESIKDPKYSGKKADIWAMGVTLFQLLFEKYPFNGSTHTELYDEIQNKKLEYNFDELKVENLPKSEVFSYPIM